MVLGRKNSRKVRKAVIPAAGLGTRFLPATKAVPKEMLPIIDTPMIQYIVEEAVKSGIEDVILITARNKEAIENHFDHNYELEDTLIRKGKDDLARVSEDISKICNLISIRQKHPLGLGHAVLCAEPVIGNEPFAVLLGDDLIDAETPCTKQLIEVFEAKESSVIGVMEVEESEVSKYGIVGGKKIEDRLTQVKRVVEKPSITDAPSKLAIPGRYVLSPEIFEHLRNIQPGKIGEIQLTDGLEALANHQGLLAYEFIGERYDTGDRMGYLDATLNFAMKRQDLKRGVMELMKKYLGAGSQK